MRMLLVCRCAALVFSSLGFGLLAACSSDDSPGSPPPDPSCTAANNCTFFAVGSTEEQVQNRIATAKAGQTIKFGEGTFKFVNQIALPSNVSNLTVLGAGIDKTVIDFSAQTSGNDGIFAQNVTNLRLEGFTVKNSVGNAIKVLKGTGVTFRSLKTHWTTEDKTKHGAYGIYPVESTNVLVEKSIAIGAVDTGIYVGQSKNIVVRDNEVYENVAGIEIENSFTADVYNNNAHDNTGGILVFDLPHLPQTGGHDIRVFKNDIHDNNTANFAPSASTVAAVPKGTGFFVLANSNVEVFENTFKNNVTAQTSVLSYFILQQPIDDPNYKQPFPSNIYIHDNTYAGGGASPDQDNKLGIVLKLGKFPGDKVPDLLYDGIVTTPPTPAPAGNPLKVCFKNNPGAVWANLHFDKMEGIDLGAVRVMSPPELECELPRLAPVSLPGL
ncbi:parallel beta-helix domain-containing protein [Pendulispora albinea]|uniref:Right-handed parallel beta-helix repeat-containing protein n=1 Tax=Pendulispora albinea TaxID=2741071 RepID=A0ABZ2LNR6_9BACT